MDLTAPRFVQNTVCLLHVSKQMDTVTAAVMATMDLIAHCHVRRTVHHVYAHKQMVPALKTVILVTMVISATRRVPATVINKDVTNRVGDVSVVIRASMVITVS